MSFVLLRIKCGFAICIYKAVENVNLFSCVRNELFHLLDSHSAALSAAVEPKLVNRLLVDFCRVTQLVVVEFEAHELYLSDQRQLVTQIWDLHGIQFQDDLKEG